MSNLIKLSLSKRTYENLGIFAQEIHDGFIAEVAAFPTPNPIMTDFQTDIDSLTTARVAWGDDHNRGSHVDHVNLLTAVAVVRDDLRMLSAYAQNAQPNQPAKWQAVGFTPKSPKSAPKPLQMVQQFRRFISRTLVEGTIKLKWKRPADTAASDVKVYVVQYSPTSIQPAIDGTRGVVNGILVTDTSIIIEPPFVGANYFWVTAFNAMGYGVSSEPVFYNSAGKP